MYSKKCPFAFIITDRTIKIEVKWKVGPLSIHLLLQNEVKMYYYM